MVDKPSFTFSKKERLKNKSDFNTLIKNGVSFTLFPFKVYFYKTQNTSSAPVLVGISIPKRKFSKAVDRNKLKRLVREAYRLNKHIVYQNLKEQKSSLKILFVYLADKPLPFIKIEKKIKLILQETNNKL